MRDKCKEVINKINELLYGENGIVTIAFSDMDLKTYYWNMDEVIDILKKIKELENKFTKEQIRKLQSYKRDFLLIENGKNRIEETYEQIKNIYESIEEY